MLTWVPSYRPVPDPLDIDEPPAATPSRSSRPGPTPAPTTGRGAREVVRSLVTLRGLTHVDTGGIVAAPTTSLPEDFGGERNWDYRYCWLRDAALALESLLAAGRLDQAQHWRDWLLRALAGDPEDMQVMYTVEGGRHLPEPSSTTSRDTPGPDRCGSGTVRCSSARPTCSAR